MPKQQEIVERLTHCATQIAEVDAQMLEIRQQIEQAEDEPTPADLLIEKLRRIDMA